MTSEPSSAATPSTPPETANSGRSFGAYIFVLLIVGLLGTVGYLMSELNSRRYRIMTEDHHVLVQRGRFLPYGFEPYAPQEASLKAIYAPISIPTDAAAVPTSDIFVDRADVDRALFTLMAGWAHDALAHDTQDALQHANAYVERSERLPGISEEQRKELRILRGDVAFSKGKAMVNELKSLLSSMRSAFQLAVDMGTSHAAEAQIWIKRVDERLHIGADETPPIPQQELAPAPAGP